ncbi:hypothetical protein CKF58_05535 [Psittacicella hinzii]|uniref:Uncharacterized protein n=1 Tax=Psittacicella hinzii TaxID=2028575 RepID=A0A3A1YLB6_9GAMM|nr:hypothetical protein CKF58_05535 [Psittacicella hinzii]
MLSLSGLCSSLVFANTLTYYVNPVQSSFFQTDGHKALIAQVSPLFVHQATGIELQCQTGRTLYNPAALANIDRITISYADNDHYDAGYGWRLNRAQVYLTNTNKEVFNYNSCRVIFTRSVSVTVSLEKQPHNKVFFDMKYTTEEYVPPAVSKFTRLPVASCTVNPQPRTKAKLQIYYSAEHKSFMPRALMYRDVKNEWQVCHLDYAQIYN